MTTPHESNTTTPNDSNEETLVLPPTSATANAPSTSRKDARFWLVLSGLLLSTFIVVLEGYAVSTALPVIVSDLNTDQFVWVASAYAISGTVILPLVGGLAQVFGRRMVVLSSLFLFAAGAAISGSAQDINMLIVGRAIHGAGSGGVLSSNQIILSDIVTLEERGIYNGLIGLVFAIGGGIGPLIGGALSRHTLWRWLFYMNVPVTGIVFASFLFFLKMKRPPPPESFQVVVSKLDIIGNILVIGSSCSCAVALTWAGVQFPWGSSKVLVPLVVGLVGFCMWILYELHVPKYPAAPFRVLSNRTSMSGYFQAFVAAFVNVNLLYYLPVYYQACKDASPLASGVDVLSFCFSTGSISIIIGVSIAITKRYRPQLWVAWVLVVVGVALLSTVSENTPRGASVGYQFIAGVGVGIVYAGAYFPVLAPLPVNLSAPALAFFVFVRSFAQIWGITAGGAIVQNELLRRLPAEVRSALPSGLSANANIAYAAIPLVPTLPQPVRDEARRAFAETVATVWRMLIAIAGVALLAALPMRGLPLHTARDERYTMKEGGGEQGADEK